MWLICFQPIGSDKLVPQIICNTEQEAKDWVKKAPFSVVGSYIYMFVALATPVGYFKREEPYQLPSYNPVVPYYVEERRPPAQWQYEVGDWPFPPQIRC